MRVHIWYSADMDEWRWSLFTKRNSPDGKDSYQTTGSHKDVTTCMDKVKTTVESLVNDV